MFLVKVVGEIRSFRSKFFQACSRLGIEGTQGQHNPRHLPCRDQYYLCYCIPSQESAWYYLPLRRSEIGSGADATSWLMTENQHLLETLKILGRKYQNDRFIFTLADEHKQHKFKVCHLVLIARHRYDL